MIYIGVTLLGYPEADVWKMTPKKILTLFKIHKRFHPDQFNQEADTQEADLIDVALGGF